MEFRLDGVDGRLIGEALIAYTGGKTNYVVLSGPVKRGKGIHDLFIVARGERADPAGNFVQHQLVHLQEGHFCR